MGTFLELLVVWPVLANSGQMMASLLMYDSFLRRYNGARVYLLEQALLETMEVHSWEDWGWYLGRMTAPQEQE